MDGRRVAEQLPHALAGLHVPDANRIVARAAGELARAKGAEAHHVVLVSFEGLDTLAGLRVPEIHRAARRTGDSVVCVGTHLFHPVFVRQRSDAFAFLHVPNADRPVLRRTREEAAPQRQEGTDAVNPVRVAEQDLAVAALHIPDANRLVARAARNQILSE